MTVTCPKCQQPARTVITSYGQRSSCCGLWSWDGAPLVDADTHNARMAAHRAFDSLWQRHGFSRSEAYRLLATRLGIPPRRCHMKQMDAATARRVPLAVMQILQDEDAQVIE